MTLASSQVYQELIEQYSDEDRMHCSSGILVESALHRKYDRLEWSLYCKVRVDVSLLTAEPLTNTQIRMVTDTESHYPAGQRR